MSPRSFRCAQGVWKDSGLSRGYIGKSTGSGVLGPGYLCAEYDSAV